MSFKTCDWKIFQVVRLDKEEHFKKLNGIPTQVNTTFSSMIVLLILSDHIFYSIIVLNFQQKIGGKSETNYRTIKR